MILLVNGARLEGENINWRQGQISEHGNQQMKENTIETSENMFYVNILLHLISKPCK